MWISYGHRRCEFVVNFFGGSLSCRKPSILLRRRRRNKGISMLCCRAGLLGARNGSEFHVWIQCVFLDVQSFDRSKWHPFDRSIICFRNYLPLQAWVGWSFDHLILWSFDQHQFFSWLILFAASGRYAHSGGWGAPQGVRPFLLKKNIIPPYAHPEVPNGPKTKLVRFWKLMVPNHPGRPKLPQFWRGRGPAHDQIHLPVTFGSGRWKKMPRRRVPPFAWRNGASRIDWLTPKNGSGLDSEFQFLSQKVNDMTVDMMQM